MNSPSNSASSASWRLVMSLDLDRMALGEFLEIVQRLDRRRRQFLLRIVEHGERIFGDRARARIAPVALGVLMQRGAEESGLLRAELGERARAQAVDLPVFCPAISSPPAPGSDTSRTTAARTPRSAGPASGRSRTAGRKSCPRWRARAGGAAFNASSQVGQRVFVELVLAQLEHRLDVGMMRCPRASASSEA